MSNERASFLRMAGIILGFVVGGLSVAGLTVGLYYRHMAQEAPSDWAGLIAFTFGVPGTLIAAATGAVAGAVITRILTRRGSSMGTFCRVGLWLTGIPIMVLGILVAWWAGEGDVSAGNVVVGAAAMAVVGLLLCLAALTLTLSGFLSRK
jgi:multisubunit Na+/H+ antiporter MnhE subunit